MDETRHSPLQGAAVALAGLPIGARELPFITQVDLRVDPDSPASAAIGKALGGALPTVPCTSARLGDIDALWLGPDEWLLLAVPGRADEIMATVRGAAGDAFASITDVSAQRTAVELTGDAVRDVLARGCAIDLHPSKMPAGACVQTLLAQAPVTLLVRDSEVSRVLVLIRASFAEYFAAWLADACKELD
jgi:sarcosine oxidase subunit gamma